jgi:8-oxo-dGTP diphosphatase
MWGEVDRGIVMSYHIRVCVRAVIINNNSIVLNEFNDGEYYNLPGGGAEPGESIKDAVVREVKEETGLDVKVGELLFVLDYEPNKCDGCYGDIHKLHIVFRCSLIGDTTILPPTIPDVDPMNPDTKCNGAKWIPLKELHNVHYVPYIHKSLMEYVENNVFTPRFFEEPLVREL